MAHVRKDTLCRSVQWWKHLRDWKRVQAKKERQAAKRDFLAGWADYEAGRVVEMDRALKDEPPKL